MAVISQDYSWNYKITIPSFPEVKCETLSQAVAWCRSKGIPWMLRTN